MIHLHVHSSSKDAVGTLEKLVKYCKEIGCKAMALTDHGNIGSIPKFYDLMRFEGLVPIAGNEIYLEYLGTIYHLTVLAKNKVGWLNLVEINNISQGNQNRGRPLTTIDDLINNKEGLIVLSGCFTSPMQKLPRDQALDLAQRLLFEFKDDFYIEAMLVSESSQHIERAKYLLDELGMDLDKILVTNDAHYTKKEYAPVHKINSIITSGFAYDGSQIYLKSESELIEYANEHLSGDLLDLYIRGIRNTDKILDKIKDYGIKSSGIVLPDTGYEDDEYVLRTIIKRLLRKKGYKTGSKHYKRAMYELEIIITKGFVEYFLIFFQLLGIAKKLDMIISIRGSAVGCFILWLTGEFKLIPNPVDWNIPFERFINRMRMDFPDIDVDIPSDMRQLFLDQIAEVWPMKQIITVSKYKHSSLVNDLGKFFKISQHIIAEMSDKGSDSDVFVETCKKHPTFKLCYDAMLNQIRHYGKHAAGVVLTPVDDKQMAIRIVNGIELTAYDMESVERLGLVKYDMLGLKTLASIQHMYNKVGYVPTLEMMDKKTYQYLYSLNNDGIMQVSGSSGLKNFVNKLKPRNYEEVIATLAIYRPGPLNNNYHTLYIERRNGAKYNLGVLEPFADILKTTYGLILYQEQVSAIIARFCTNYYIQEGNSKLDAHSMGLGIGEIFRKISSKAPYVISEKSEKKRNKLLDIISMFKKGSKGILSESDCDEIVETLLQFCRYSFNRGHSSSYAFLSLTTAYYKAHYTGEFIASCLTYFDKKQSLFLQDAIIRGIKISLPNVNVSADKYVYSEEHNTIYLPFHSLKGIGDKTGAIISAERELNGPYKDYNDFDTRLPKRKINLKVKRIFYACGVFGDIAPDSFDDIKTNDKKYAEYKSWKPEYLQLHFLDFVIPSDKKMKKLSVLTQKGYIITIVRKYKQKRSRYHGSYYTVYYTDNGVNWETGTQRFEVGDMVAIKKLDKGKGIFIKV